MMRVTLTLLAVAVVSASTYTRSDSQERAQVRQVIDGDDDGGGRGGSYGGLGSPERGTFSAFGIGRSLYGDRVVSLGGNGDDSFEGSSSLGDSSEGGRRTRVYPSSLGQGLSRGGGLQGARILGSSSEEGSSEGNRLARVIFDQGSYGGGGQRGAGIVGSSSEEGVRLARVLFGQSSDEGGGLRRAGTGSSSIEKGSFEGGRLAGVLIGRGSSEERSSRRAGSRFIRVRLGGGSSEGSSSSSESESSEEGGRGRRIKIEKLVGGRVGSGSSEEGSFGGSGSSEGGRFRGSESSEGDSDEGGRGISRGVNRPHVKVNVKVVLGRARAPVLISRKDSAEVIRVVSAPVNQRRGGYY